MSASRRCWRDEIQLTEAVELTQARRVGHQQITDAYLLGLAVHKKCKLVTLDRKVPALLAQSSEKRDLVVVL
jgi:predicted nucleic acid-binding protein